MSAINIRIGWPVYKALKHKAKASYTSMTGYARTAIAERLKTTHLIAIQEDSEPKKISISLYLPDEFREGLLALANKTGVTLSDVIRAIIVERLNREGGQ